MYLFNLGEAKTSVLLYCFSVNVRDIEGVAYASLKKLREEGYGWYSHLLEGILLARLYPGSELFARMCIERD